MDGSLLYSRTINPPIYGTPLTLGIIRNKLEEHSLQWTPKLNTVNAGDRVRAGEFEVEFIHVNHSIADACALAEWKYGAGKGTENMIFLTFGTGMGAGLILGGKLYSGSCGMAGEIGHVRMAPFGPTGYGKIGSFEGFCSGGGIAQLGRTFALEKLQRGETLPYCKNKTELDGITAKTLAEFARAGDETALAVYRFCGEKLGEGLSILIDMLNPQRIVIGSIFARAQDLLREPMENVLKREALSHSLARCEIVPAALGEEIGDYAALAVSYGS